MQIQTFQNTDTPYMIFNTNQIGKTKALHKNGNWVSITIEHASEYTGVAGFSYQPIAAPVAATGQKLAHSTYLTDRVSA